MIDSSFVEAVVENAQPRTITVGGKEYSTAAVHNPPLPTEPRYPTLALLSLDSLIEMANYNSTENTRLIACHPNSVHYCSPPTGENRQRDVFASVSFLNVPFTFGQFMALEDLRVGLLTKFVETPTRHELLVFLSKVADENVKTAVDDGVSQVVTVKAGIASYGSAKVPSPIALQPIRTFVEVDQPEGIFVLRMKSVKDALPVAALFEMTNGWERQAAINVRDYLAAKVTVKVYA